jgi:predicted double-glycine peptidase
MAGSAFFTTTGGGVYNVPIKSLVERKFEHVVRQQYDFSCGSAALATLLTFHYADPTSEQKAFGQMYEAGDKEKIAKVGFSLLDMKSYLAKQGYEADGFQSSLDTLGKAGVPAIALIRVKGYQHFVVIKGVHNDEVLVGDPALGIKAVARADFEKMWTNGIFFIVRNKAATGQKYFNLAPEWSSLARAPIGEAMKQEALAAVTLSLPIFTRPFLGDF